MQVVNVAYGGTLDQHLPDRLEDDIHRGEAGAFVDHEVEVDPESLAALAAGATRVAVKSYHHQGVVGSAGAQRHRARADDGTWRRSRTPPARYHARRPLAPRGGRGRPPDRGVRACLPGPARRRLRAGSRRHGRLSR